MTTHFRPVLVHQVPSRSNSREGVAFLQMLKDNASPERPRIVLDCSRLQHVDLSAVHLLLCCLEEGMKRNGDVRLAGLNPSAEAVLRRNGLLQLFEVFSSPAAAVDSYSSPFMSNLSPMQALERAEGSAA